MLIITDDFTGTDGDAPNTAIWPAPTVSGVSSAIDIRSNTMELRPVGDGTPWTGSVQIAALRNVANFNATLSVNMNTMPSNDNYIFIWWRASALWGNGYAVFLQAANNPFLHLFRMDAGSGFSFGTAPVGATLAQGDTWNFDIQHVGGKCDVYAWKTGGKPSSPTLTGTDNTYTSGKFGFILESPSGTTVRERIDSLRIDDMSVQAFLDQHNNASLRM